MPNTANAEWNGDLKEGKGQFEIGDGSISGGFSFKSRFEDADEPGANPEELIAAAHASCFSMALANMLSEHGHDVKSIKTTANVKLKIVDDAPKIVSSALKVVGDVPDTDADHFAEHAEEAKQGCPVSQALAGLDEITLETEFVS